MKNRNEDNVEIIYKQDFFTDFLKSSVSTIYI
jgi:hypothetical protein